MTDIDQKTKDYSRIRDNQMSIFENYARKKGLQSKSMLILMWIYDNPEGIPQHAIAQKTYSTKQVVNATIKSFKEKGYLLFEENPQDKRMKLTGEFFVIVGTSGSGKTTTLKMINRLLTPTEGTVLIDGTDISQLEPRQLRLNIGYVLQTGALFPNLTVYENIEIIPEMKGWPKEERQKTIRAYLSLVGLDADQYMNRYPRDLSGGEQPRVGILRAIVAKPDILLMDEPFSALDPISRNQLQELIKNLHRTFKMTIVFVTHDMAEAVKLGDRICVMSSGDVVQLDTPQEVKAHPAHEVVKRFFDEG